MTFISKMKFNENNPQLPTMGLRQGLSDRLHAFMALIILFTTVINWKLGLETHTLNMGHRNVQLLIIEQQQQLMQLPYYFRDTNFVTNSLYM